MRRNELGVVSDAHIKSQLAPGNTYVFYGKVARKTANLVMEQAAIYSGEAYACRHGAGIFAGVWCLTGEISPNNLVTKTVRSVLGREELFKEYLPQEIRSRYKTLRVQLCDQRDSFSGKYGQRMIAARNRLVFDEFSSLF